MCVCVCVFMCITQDCHWSEVCKERTCSREVEQYRNAVWDLFQTEAKFLIHFLQPLDLVYKSFLELLHFHGILMVADVDKIFANLSELCEVRQDVGVGPLLGMGVSLVTIVISTDIVPLCCYLVVEFERGYGSVQVV